MSALALTILAEALIADLRALVEACAERRSRLLGQAARMGASA